MPSGSSIGRSLDWACVRKTLPKEIGLQLPSGDPLTNQQEIKNCISEMRDLGPYGTVAKAMYVNEEITFEEFQTLLDTISESVRPTELDKFRSELQMLHNSIQSSTLKQFTPFVKTIDAEQAKQAAKNLHQVDIYTQLATEAEVSTEAE
jgi:hypothetical protein